MSDTQTAADAPSPDDIETPEEAAARSNKRKRLFTIFIVVLLVLAAAWGIWYFFTQAGRVSTDNAYVGADTAQVTAVVPGNVLEVRVGGTQQVKKGDVLVVLDDADARIAVAQAEAALRQAQQRYRQSLASVNAAQGRLGARGADIAQARARVRDADASVARTQAEYARRQSIASTGAVSAEELTAARTAVESARAARDLAAAGRVPRTPTGRTPTSARWSIRRHLADR